MKTRLFALLFAGFFGSAACIHAKPTDSGIVEISGHDPRLTREVHGDTVIATFTARIQLSNDLVEVENRAAEFGFSTSWYPAITKNCVVVYRDGSRIHPALQIECTSVDAFGNMHSSGKSFFASDDSPVDLQIKVSFSPDKLDLETAKYGVQLTRINWRLHDSAKKESLEGEEWAAGDVPPPSEYVSFLIAVGSVMLITAAGLGYDQYKKHRWRWRKPTPSAAS